MMCLFSECNSR